MIIRWLKNGSSLRQQRTIGLGQIKQWTAVTTTPASIWSLVANNQSNTTGAGGGALSLGVTLSSVVAGDLLVCSLSTNGGGATSFTVTDTQGNTWSQIGSFLNYSGNARMSLWWTVAKSSGSDTVTATANTGTPRIALAVDEFHASNGQTPILDGSNTGSGFSTLPSTSSTVPVTGSDDLMLACYGQTSINEGTVTAGAGFTLLDNLPNGSSNSVALATEYKVGVAAGLTPSFTQSTSASWGCIAASFKTTTPPAGSAVQLLSMLGCGN